MTKCNFFFFFSFSVSRYLLLYNIQTHNLQKINGRRLLGQQPQLYTLLNPAGQSLSDCKDIEGMYYLKTGKKINQEMRIIFNHLVYITV